ncbi:YihY/virulence factor BrkB family protein [Luteibacter jiangsuensis]|uniref:YihY/virulence factor BrkB family protein n=1 Tax=Luteibacter jiangsuensis TaxID=637577 RepID=A0ABX0Q6H4_9GAMM|nr:YihY/virulence factor BrkB family protein [Luteibacter jiangsuensis]NID06124.1 YihY/virulence factor BrkB family protein [Luteibacter jiangsuensis]
MGVLSGIKRTIVSAVEGFSDDELMTRAAALSFYAALSFAPLLLLLVWLVSMLHPAWQGELSEALAGVVGERAAEALNVVIESAKSHPKLGDLAGIIGIGVTLFGASAVFAQLQATLDRVWRVKAKPGEAVGAWLRARARAFALLGGIAFMMIISFLVSALIQALVRGEGMVWKMAEYAISVLVFVTAFGAMYKVLPDALISWSEALIGAVLTTVLFLAGKYAIGLYIQYANVGGAYGPAGAFIVLLTWTYYSSIIVLMGAELTRGVADARGKPIQPSEHAVRIEAAPAELPDDEPGQPAGRL